MVAVVVENLLWLLLLLFVVVVRSESDAVVVVVAEEWERKGMLVHIDSLSQSSSFLFYCLQTWVYSVTWSS